MHDKLRVVTNSERSAFQCEKKWWFSYVEGLTPHETPTALVQGSLMHMLLEEYYRSNMQTDIDQLKSIVIDPWIELQQDRSQTKLYPDQWLSERSEWAVMCLTMMDGYMAHWDDSGWQVLAVEPQICRSIIHPATEEPLRDSRGREWVYSGRVDVVIKDLATDLDWLVEHKTTSHTDLDGYCTKLTFDPQIRGYAWAPRSPHPEHSQFPDGIKPVGVIYNVLKKSIPSEPKVLKNGKLSTDKRQNTTVEKFRRAIAENKGDESDYEDVLETLAKKKFFHRTYYTISDNDCDDFGMDIYYAAKRMLEAESDDYHPRQQSACTGPGTYRCDFTGPCLEDGPLSRVDYQLKSCRHEELDGDLAEPGFLNE